MLDKPRILLHLEGAALLGASLYAYHWLHGSWLVFALLILVPDLSMLGYLLSTRVGSACYNLVHTTTGPVIAAAAVVLTHHNGWLPVILIWTTHIGVDRLMGFGLKYPTAFKDTHLQRV
jgi:Domain of unknown function (DUF4260)